MAIEAYVADTPARKRPIDEHGKLRFLYGKTTVAVQGDIGSTFKLGTLPPGAVRVLPYLGAQGHSAWGAARTISIGLGAYRYKQDQASAGDGIQAAQAAIFASALDFSALVTGAVLNATLMKWDVYSLGGADVIATLAGGTVPVGATIEMLLPYIYE